MATDSTAINPTSDDLTRSDSSRALAVKSPQYLQLTNKAGTQSEYIRDGWSWGGFSFGVFWLVRHRVWSSIILSLLALIGGGLAILASVKYLGTTEFVKSIAALSVAALLLIHLFLGGRGNFWRQATLVGRGWIPVRKIFAKNVDEAMEVGESALADLPVHRAPEMGVGTNDGDAESKPNLPELRPLLKTGEPEIRTVRRPESQSETSTTATDTTPMSATANTDSNEVSAKSSADEDTNSTWKVASQRISKSDKNEAGGASAGSASSTATSGDSKSDKPDSVVSDTSRFDAPAPVLKTTTAGSTKKADADKADKADSDRRDKAETVATESSESIAAAKSTSTPAAAASTTAPKRSVSESGGDRPGGSDVEIDSNARLKDSRFGSDPSHTDDEEGKESPIRKRPTFTGSPEAMFERTLGGPRNRNTPARAAETSGRSTTQLRNSQAGSDSTRQQSDAAGKSRPGTDQRQPRSPRPEQAEQERIRLEPTLRPQAPKAPPAPLTAATAKTAPSTPDQGQVDADSRRKTENENNELFEVAWNEIESGKMISALEARALTQHPDNTDQRKALYIRMRVAQLREERLLAREEATAARRRRAQRIAELEREEVYRDFVQIVQPNHASLRHAKPTLANFARSTDSDSDLSLKVLNDAVESIGMTVVFAPMAGYVAECNDGQMLELGNREQLNEFLLVLMNSDRTVSSGGGNASNGNGSTTGHPGNPG